MFLLLTKNIVSKASEIECKPRICLLSLKLLLSLQSCSKCSGGYPLRCNKIYEYKIFMSKSFEQLGLNSALCETLRTIGFDAPTSIQSQAITPILWGQDLIACAKTGSGKTGSFLLPLIHILNESPVRARMPRALILEPTRELAIQVLEQFQRFAGASLKAALIVGGESMVAQEKSLQSNPDVLVVTPGRLLDFCEREKIMLFGIKHVVIDEADRMLDMGFLPDVKRILEKIPVSRQTLLFSATFDKEIESLSSSFMLAPKMLSISEQGQTVDTIDQKCIHSQEKDKSTFVLYLIKQLTSQKNDELSEVVKDSIIVFCNRKSDVDKLSKYLVKYGIAAAGLHGDLSQSIRNQTIESFKVNEIQVLVASDIIARGIDIESLSMVINFDVPIQCEDYVHRIGRTGRAGNKGQAYTLVSVKDTKKWQQVESLIQKTVEVYEVTAEALSAMMPPRVSTRRLAQKDNDNNELSVLSPSSSKRFFEDDSPSKNVVQKTRRRRDNREESEDIVIVGFGSDVPLFFRNESYKTRIIGEDSRTFD